MALHTEGPTPESIVDLTLDWFNEYIAPQIGPYRACAVECEDGSAGRGFTTQVVRVRVQWTPTAHDLPKSIIVKLALPQLAARSDGYLAALEVERRWYEADTTTCPVRVPMCYWASTDTGRRTFCLALEDLWWMRAIDPEDGLTVDQAKIALTALATLHGYRARATELPQRASALPQEFMQSIEQSWDAFMNFCGDAIPQGFYDLRGFIGAVLEGAAAVRAAPRTFVHGDYKLDNLLFAPKDADAEIAVLDWQGASYGWPIEELAGFLPRSLKSDVAVEPLLSDYHRLAPCGNGATRLSADEFSRHYEYGLVLSLATNVAAMQTLLSGEWSARDEQRQARMLDYMRLVLFRKLRAIGVGN